VGDGFRYRNPLAAGNSVLAKPAEQTPLIAAQAVQILLDAGVPAPQQSDR
jgi:delta 1-pyrroline-5-carboxylate dehydrogenase